MSDLLDDALPQVPIKDQIACVERELAMRRRVYPKWVEDGRMTATKAAEEIRRMEAVLATLHEVGARGDRLGADARSKNVGPIDETAEEREAE